MGLLPFAPSFSAAASIDRLATSRIRGRRGARRGAREVVMVMMYSDGECVDAWWAKSSQRRFQPITSFANPMPIVCTQIRSSDQHQDAL